MSNTYVTATPAPRPSLDEAVDDRLRAVLLALANEHRWILIDAPQARISAGRAQP
jgi:hypothetical protein